MPTISRTRFASAAAGLVTLLSHTAAAQPHIELGLAVGRDLGSSLAPPSGGDISLLKVPRVELGIWLTRKIGIAVSADVATEVNFEGASAYSLITPLVEVATSETRVRRLRVGIGWAATQAGNYEKGEGISARLGVGLDLPPSSFISAMLTADVIAGLSGSYRRISTFPVGPPRDGFDLRVLQVGVALHLGG